MSILSQKIDVVIKLMDLLRADSAETQTPVNLVNMMLDKLPTKIWQDSTKTFLDPACGRGIFGLCILQRLFDGLQSVIPDEQERVNHILGKQIFLYDISSVMCMKANAAFARAIEAAVLVNPGVNIYNKDSLEHPFNMKFDVIIGNPPYNKGKRSSASGSGNSIWEKFLPAMWSHLQNDGYVCFVHPPEWRTNRYSRSKRNASKLMFDNQIKWIRAAFPFPGAGCSVDAYVLQKTNGQRQETIWENADGSIHKFVIEQDAPYLASMQSAVINKILGKVLSQKNQDFYERKAMGGLIVLDNTTSGEFTFVSGAKFTEKKQAHPHIHQFKMKVIMSDNRAFRPFFDAGTLGIGDHVHYALVKSPQEGQWLIHLINSKLSRWMQWIFCEGYNASKGVHGGEPWNCARPLSLINFADEETDGNDMYFYKHFGLTQEEIAYVESTVK